MRCASRRTHLTTKIVEDTFFYKCKSLLCSVEKAQRFLCIFEIPFVVRKYFYVDAIDILKILSLTFVRDHL